MNLKHKIKHIVCPLGVSSHFYHWGFNPDIIHDEDWYREIKLSDNLKIHILPSRHFSGRFLDNNKNITITTSNLISFLTCPPPFSK